MLGALCYVCVANIDELTIWTFQLELGEFGTGLEPLEFVSAALLTTYVIYSNAKLQSESINTYTKHCLQILNWQFLTP